MTAARRMKGVVRPHARPTRRKLRVQLKGEGEGELEGSVVDILVEDGVGGEGVGRVEVGYV